MLKFSPDKEKVLEALVYITERAGDLSPFFAGKILYFADVDHLRKFGRPITGDLYIAMENGPVPSFAYNVVKGDITGSVKHLADQALERTIVKHPVIKARRPADLSFFSMTDQDCLDHAIEHVMGRSFGQISDETHDHVAWKNAGLNEAMSFDDMLHDADEQVIEDAKAFAAYGVL